MTTALRVTALVLGVLLVATAVLILYVFGVPASAPHDSSDWLGVMAFFGAFLACAGLFGDD